jgi:site-specific recombinase
LPQLIELVDALRPADAGNALLATARFTALCQMIEGDDAARRALRGCLLKLFTGRRQISFFADSGILPNTGFFSELWRRMVHRIFPALTDPAYLRDCINLIFHRRDDYAWMGAIPTELKLRLWQGLRMDEVRDDPALLEALAQMLDATDVLATRIGAMGLEPELVRLHPRIEERGSPFLALAVEAHQLSATYRAYPRRIGQQRRRRPPLVELWVEFSTGRSTARLRARASAISRRQYRRLLSAACHRHASRAGEHYITTTRAEYFSTCAGHVGFIVGSLALLKVFPARQTWRHWDCAACSMNYSFGSADPMLHLTLAIKSRR